MSSSHTHGGFPVDANSKEHACHCRRHKRWGFDPWVRKILWRRAWQPTPVLLPGESHEQNSLAGYSPQVRKVTEHFSYLWTRKNMLENRPRLKREDGWLSEKKCVLGLQATLWKYLIQQVALLDNTWLIVVCYLVTQSFLILCDTMDCSPPGSSVREILQARILEWVAI